MDLRREAGAERTADGAGANLALHFDRHGEVREFEAPGRVSLPRTRIWRIPRGTRADPEAPATILETLANQGATAHAPDFLVARVREALARSITALYTEGNGKLHVVALHPECEQVLVAAARDSESSGGVAIAPGFTREFLSRLETVLRAAYAGGTPPVLLVPTPIRLFVKRLIEPTYPNLAVMGYTEVTSSASIVSAGTVVTNGARLEQQAVA